MPRPSPFIIPAQPALRDRPPKGDGWLHELKFDGYRVQLHKDGKDVVIFSRNGMDFTSRFAVIANAVAQLPAKSAIMDAEVVASNSHGEPDFIALHDRAAKTEDICCWAFDLLSLNGADQRQIPLLRRRNKLQKLLNRHRAGFIVYSYAFDDADGLLDQCERRGIEGIVSKRKDAPYRSGKGDWIKVKTKAWREANRGRGELFGQGR